MANDDLILDALEYINPADLGYKTWINIGYALKNENFPLEVWDSWSRTDKRHKDRDGNVESLQINGKIKCKAFLDWIYKDSTIFLDRKKRLYQQLY